MEAIEQFQKRREYQERRTQIETYKKLEADSAMRDQRLAEVNAKRLAEIKAGIEKMKKNQ